MNVVIKKRINVDQIVRDRRNPIFLSSGVTKNFKAIANSILSVQPMTGPVGKKFNLKYKLDDDELDEDD